MNVSIRSAGTADVATLTRFNVMMARESEDKGLDPARLQRGILAVLDNPRHGAYWLAESGGRDVGALLVTFEWSDWRNGRFWWIQSVYVEPDFRRRGVYRALHQHVRNRAREDSDTCGLRLYVEKNNSVAQRTYRALDMVETDYRLYEEEWPPGAK